MINKELLCVENTEDEFDTQPTTFGGQIRQGFVSLLHSKSGLLGGIIIACVLVTAIFAPLVAPYDPHEQVLLEARKSPLSYLEESKRFTILGTDHVGRDIFSRIVYASRITLLVAFAAVLISGFVGLCIGIAAGYLGGWIDSICMRLVDIVLAFPFELLALSIVAVTGPSLGIVILVMSLRIWVVYARVIRGSTLSVKEKDFVQAAESIGASRWWIVIRHIVPNVMTPVIVVATLYVGRMILIEAALSFLGLGVPPPTPTWGGILGDGRAYIDTAWWIALFPGLAILITVLGVNLLGDWFRDYLDPRID